MMPDFHSPHLLWLLVPWLLLFGFELFRHSISTVSTWPKIARAWAGAFQVSLGARHTTAENRPRLWLWFGLALCLIALARPQWGAIEEQVFDQAREVLIAVDLSKSMLAQDVKPSRLDRSKLLIQSLLDSLKGERVGLVLFAGTAFLQSPLSSDYEILREFLPSMNPDYLPEGGSNYTALLETSIQAFGTSTADRYLIILSDGESTTDDWKKLPETLKQKGIRVIGLGVGTPGGAFIPDGSGGYVKDERGAVVMSRLNTSTLQELAQLTGGTAVEANTWIDLPALLQKTVEAGRKGQFAEKNTTRKVERYQWFLGPGLLLLCLSFWAEFPVRPRERALPLGKMRGQVAAKATSFALALLGLSALAAPLSALAAEGGEDPLAKPLSTAVARLSEKADLTAKDYAELAQTTLTYGQRAQSAQPPAPEAVIHDALQAVDLGERLDAKTTDWPKLREDLRNLLKKEEQKKDDQKKNEQKPQNQKQDQQKDQEQKQDQSKQDQKQNEKQDQNQNQPQNQDQQKSGDPQSNQQPKTPDQQPKKNEDAFGDMKDQQKSPDPKPQTPDPKPKTPPPPGTQKVGGQTDKKSTDEQQDPALAMPLQKLEQVRDQDSPAKLQQLMQGQQKPKPTGKDW